MVNKPYEILIRYNEDGTIRGGHIRYIDDVTKLPGSAQPIDTVDFPTSEAITDAQRDAIAELTRKDEIIAQKEARISELEIVVIPPKDSRIVELETEVANLKKSQ